MQTPEQLSALIRETLKDALAPLRDLPVRDAFTPELKAEILGRVRQALDRIEVEPGHEKPHWDLSFEGSKLGFMPTNEAACDIMYHDADSREAAKEMLRLWRQLDQMTDVLMESALEGE